MKDLNYLDNFRYTHRGLHNNIDIPENSLVAFENAKNHGFGMEFDVYLTDDNNLIIHHDPCIKRTTGFDMTTYEIDSSHLDKYKLYGTQHSIPLLSDMLRLIDGKVPLILEIKTTHKIKATCNAIYEMIKDYKGFICVESFNPFIVNWWLKHHNEYVIGQLMGDSALANAYIKMTRQYRRVDFVAPSCELLPTPYFAKIKRKKPDLRIINWTVKTKNNLDNALKYADNFIFECNIKDKEYVSLDDVYATMK